MAEEVVAAERENEGWAGFGRWGGRGVLDWAVDDAVSCVSRDDSFLLLRAPCSGSLSR